MLVASGEILVDGRHTRRDALEGAASNPPAGDGGDEAFDLIEPTRARGFEVQVIARIPYALR